MNENKMKQLCKLAGVGPGLVGCKLFLRRAEWEQMNSYEFACFIVENFPPNMVNRELVRSIECGTI